MPLGNDNLPLNVLLYDVLNTPLGDQPFAHAEIIRFLQNRPIGSRFAIFVLSDRLHLLQGFTDDQRELFAAMHRKEAGLYNTAENQSVPNFPSLAQVSPGGDPFVNDPTMKAMLGKMAAAESTEKLFFLNQRIERTLSALMEIARFLNGLPGRKNLIWLSGSFPTSIFSAKNSLNPFGSTVNKSAELRHTANLLTVGQVAVYPVDARALPASFDGEGERSGESASEEIFSDHAVMQEIADDTGGHAFYSTNALAEVIATSTDDGSNYYTLSYSPTDADFNGRLRKIRVKLREGNFNLTYRHSYFAADDAVMTERAAQAQAERLQNAAVRGAPLNYEIVFEVQIHVEGPPIEASQELIPLLARFPSFASQKAWEEVRVQPYRIDYRIVGGRISFQPSADGRHHGEFEFQYTAYDLDNRAMIGQTIRIDKDYTPKEFDKFAGGAYQLRQILQIPTGAAWLRLVVRDAVGDHIGSVEIPLPLPVESQAETLAEPK